jgi:F-box/leucine-rich repeat protein 2/20
MIEISKNCANLKVLRIPYFDNGGKITDIGLMAVAKNCHGLVEVDVSDSYHLTDLSLIELANNCSNLTVLNIRWCINMTDKGLIEIVKKCVNLQCIDLSGNKHCTDDALIAISCNCLDLRSISLSNSLKFSDIGVISIIRKCSKLEEIDLSNDVLGDGLVFEDEEDFDNITDLTLIEISKNCPNLNSLNLATCGKITDIGVFAIAKSCLELVDFDISHVKITNLTKLEIKKNLKKIMHFNSTAAIEKRFCEHLSAARNKK